MKFIASRILLAFVVVSLTASAAFAKTSRANITLNTDTLIGGTLVKSGDYSIQFDDKTGELTFKRNGKEVVKAVARTERRERKASRTEIHTQLGGSEPTLTGVAFGGSDQNVIVTSATATNK
jgi:hypothetical protein